jgi:hypothetical protein
MKRSSFIMLVSWLFMHSAAISQTDSSAIKAFDQMKRVVGEWTGTSEWSGSKTPKGKMDAKYYLTGKGSAMVEDLIADGQPVMTTVYHLDGADLRMTHYCGAGNQPRLKVASIDQEKKIIHFIYLDATNLSSESSPHVVGLDWQFPDDDHIQLVFDFKIGAAHRYEHILLDRKKSLG